MVRVMFLFFLYFYTSLSIASEVIDFGIKSKITSNVLQETRRYYVYLPPSYRNADICYPVIYLLDGDEHRWKVVAGMIEGLSSETLEQQVVEAIVVAVPSSENAIRERDLTPTNISEWTFHGKVLDKFNGNIGNAAAYLSFFKTELIPEINKTYRTTNQRVVVGESFGGLFAPYALLFDSSVFTDYLIIDPTSLWDNNYLNRAFANFKFKSSIPAANVYFAFANNSALGEIGNTNLKWGQGFAASISSSSTGKLKVKEQYFEAESHGTVALLGWYNGFKYLLSNVSE